MRCKKCRCDSDQWAVFEWAVLCLECAYEVAVESVVRQVLRWPLRWGRDQPTA